jgi:coronin-1B/1C/6
MSRIVRQSKYRHVFGTGSRQEQSYANVSPSKGAWDSNKVKASNKFVGLIWEARGGGSFAVIPNELVGKLPNNYPLVAGHKGNVLDIDFSPFNDHVVASVSEDGNGRIWSIPQGGLTQNLIEPAQSLIGHRRKVGTVNFHPTANNILATSSTDYSVKIWDIERGSAVLDVPGHSDIINSVAWNRLGTTLVTTCKDKKVRVVDPRQQRITGEYDDHPGVKSSRAIWLGGRETIFGVGFSKQSDRVFAIHDPRNLSAPIVKQNIDTSAGILMPFWDDDTGLLFLGGKGDGNIRYYEIVDERPFIHFVADYKSAVPQLGLALRPKTSVDVSSCEVASILKVTNDTVEPIHFCVPRKSEMFQDDIYPPTPGPDPALSAAEWLSGQTKEPILISLEGGFVAREKPEFAPSEVKKEEIEKPKTEVEWRSEVEALQKRVAYLEAELVKKDARIRELGGN